MVGLILERVVAVERLGGVADADVDVGEHLALMSVVPAAGGVGFVRLQVPTPTLVDGPFDLHEEPLALTLGVWCRGLFDGARGLIGRDDNHRILPHRSLQSRLVRHDAAISRELRAATIWPTACRP